MTARVALRLVAALKQKYYDLTGQWLHVPVVSELLLWLLVCLATHSNESTLDCFENDRALTCRKPGRLVSAYSR